MNEAQPQTEKPKFRPSNSIDLQTITIEPYLSSEFVSDRVRNRFRQFEEVDGRIYIKKDFWVTMELFTQDWRLSNIDNQEKKAIRINLDLCSDILTVLPEEFNKPAFLLLERSISINETSQGSKGFLRILFNSLFQNQKITEEQPQKRNFIGLGKKSNTGV